MVKKILIAENIPSLNKGEETILQGMLESFKVFGEFQVSMFSTNPQLDQNRYGSKVHVLDIRPYLPFFGERGFKSKITKYISSILFLLNHIVFLFLFNLIGINILKVYRTPLWKEYAFSDIIIIGHDGAFAIGGGPSIPVVGYPIIMPFFSKKINKISVLYAGSVPNPKKVGIFSKMAFKFSLERLDLITVRERHSYGYCVDLDIKNKNIYLTSDLAFLMKPVADERIYEIMDNENLKRNDKPLVGITVTREKANILQSNLNLYQSYQKHIKLLAEVIDNIILKSDATFVFFPHSIGPDPYLDDRLVAKDIVSHCQRKERIILINTEYSAAELKGVIGKLDLFIGERIHSVINAMSMNVPVISLSNRDDERLEIIRMFGQSNIIFFIEDVQSEALVKKANSILSNPLEIKRDLATQLQETAIKSMQNGTLLYNTVASRNGLRET